MSHPAGTELLDHPDADPVAVRRSLGNIARANRWFGGTHAVVHGVERLLAEGTRDERREARVERGTRYEGLGARSNGLSNLAPRISPLTVLDLGTGAGDIPCAVRAWGTGRGIRVRNIGLERLRPAARLAHESGLPITLGCATSLPFRSESVDVVTLSQVLHHFDTDAAVRVLREAGRVARRGVVVADLLRSRTAAALFSVGARVLGFDPHTIADGVTSVGRGYAPDELWELAQAAGLTMEVIVRPGWRVVAWGGR